jgi:hypothetical protein
MSLRLQGKTYSTLNDKIYVGNKQIKNVFLGSTSIYPNSAKKWVRASFPNNNSFMGLAAGSSRMITSQSNTCFWTETGLAWTSVTLPDYTSATSILISDGNQTFVLVSNSTVLTSTNNAETWTKITVTTRSRKFAAYGGGKFVVINSSNIYMYSNDGLNWTEATLPENSTNWGSIVWSVDRFILAMSSTVSYYYESLNGVNWTKVNNNYNFATGQIVADGLGNLIATMNASTNTINYSANNGVSWSNKQWWPFQGYSWNTGIYVNGYYVFNSKSGYPDLNTITAISQNLTDWYYINHTLPTYSTYIMVAFKNKIYTITQSQTRYYYYLDLST